MKPLSPKDPKSIGGFTLVGRLGRGGMGVVYLASRRSETVALKILRDSLVEGGEDLRRFGREIGTLEKIRSPYVAQILESGIEDEESPWFAAEFVNGPNLSELVNDKGPLDEDQWWDLARGLLKGLADVHAAGVIHRDIKPANLIIAETGPKLIDFGIAHVSDATSVTATGLVAGSPAWFSPEQIEGLELTPATDVFSAGSVLTFAASGSSPWGGETTMTKASVFKILTSEPDLTGLSNEQQELVRLMVEKSPEKRATAQSLLRMCSENPHSETENSESFALPSPENTSELTKISARTELFESAETPQERAANPPEENPASEKTSTPDKRLRFLVAGSFVTLIVVFWLFWYGNSASERCMESSDYDYAYNRYVELRDEALLSGELSLTSIQWETRAYRLNALLGAEKSRIASTSKLPAVFQHQADRVDRSIDQIIDAYSEIARLADENPDAIPQGPWDAAWYDLFDAEDALLSAALVVCDP